MIRYGSAQALSLALCAGMLACTQSSHEQPEPPGDDSRVYAALEPQKEALLRRIFEARKPDLIDWIERSMSAGDPTSLYTVQQFTSPLLTAALRLGDLEWIDGLSEVYLSALPYLSLETKYRYHYVPGQELLSEHPLDEPAQMWLDAQGFEVIPESAQFLYGVAALIHGIVALPEAHRSPAMNAVLERYPSVVLRDHYQRWIFAQRGPFQLAGWGCDAGMLNHHQYVSGRIDRQFCGDQPDALSYVNAVLDVDLWLAAGLVEMIAAHDAAPDQVPLHDDLESAYRLYLMNASMMIEERIQPTELLDSAGATTPGLALDPGVWRDHPDFAWSAYQGSMFPKADQAQVAQDCTWDVSHARRFVPVFSSFNRHQNLLSSAAFGNEFMEGLANQLVYGAFDGDFEWPLLRNYMSGHNGWYRVDPEASTGYPPFGLSRALLDGGYGVWSEFNPDIGLINDRLWQRLQSMWHKDASGAAHLAIQRGGEWAFDGVLGGGLKLGAHDHVDLGPAQAYASATGAIEFWFRYDAQSDQGDLINLWETPYQDYLLLRRLEGGQLMVLIQDDGEVVLNVITTAKVEPHRWHHVVVSQDGMSATVYIDGRDAAAKGANGSAWTEHLELKGAWFSGSHWVGHSGQVDELRLYDRSLPAGEVAAHHQGRFDDSSGLVGHWPFDTPVDHHAAAWFDEYYDEHLNAVDSWSLLQFLPVFVAP